MAIKEKVTPGWITIEEAVDKPRWRVHMRLGPTPPKVISGYGGWELVRRPRRRSLTEWTGSDPVRVQVTFLWDRFDNETPNSVETEIRDLEKLAGLIRDGAYPPLVRWECNAPHDYREAPHVDWVIESIEWDDPVYNQWGNRVRQGGTIVFLNYVEEEYTKLSPSGKKRNSKNRDNDGKSKKKGGSKVYEVKPGDTLSSIAARKLGKASRWREIAKLNNIRDPRNLRVGQKLKLP